MTEITGRVGWRTFVSAPTNNPLWNNLVAYYTGDNTPNDAKGTANGTLVNGASYSTGKINNGFSFDGINDYANFGNNLDFNGSTPFSFSAWVKPTTLGELNCILSKMVAATAQGYYLRLENGIKFVMYNADTSGVAVTTTTSIPLNVYTHITVTYSGNGLGNGFNIYVNGVNTTLTIVRNAFYGSASNTASFSIGSQYTGISASLFFKGVIDEVGAWSRALTATEVTELYNAGAGKQYVAPTYTARTNAFATATGITDTTILNALNTFDTGLISNGLDTKMKALYPMVGGTATTHKFNFMDARDLNTAFRIQFNGGWVHSSTGAKGNGTNTYMNTFFNQFNNFTDWKKSTLGIYSRTNESGLFLEGNYGFNDSNFALYTRLADGRFLFQAGAPFATAVTSDSLGFLVGSSISGSDRRVYKNGVKLATNTETNTLGVLTGLNTYFGALNGSGTATYISNKDYALAFLGESMTDTDQTTLYTLTQALQTSLSRQV